MAEIKTTKQKIIASTEGAFNVITLIQATANINEYCHSYLDVLQREAR